MEQVTDRRRAPLLVVLLLLVLVLVFSLGGGEESPTASPAPARRPAAPSPTLAVGSETRPAAVQDAPPPSPGPRATPDAAPGPSPAPDAPRPAGLLVRLSLELEHEPLAITTLAFRRGDERVVFCTDADGDAELTLLPGAWTLEVPDPLGERSGPWSLRHYPRLDDPGQRFQVVEAHERLQLDVLAADPAPPPPIDPGGPLSMSDPAPDLQVTWSPREVASGERLRIALSGALTLEARVLDPDGAPVAGAQVVASRDARFAEGDPVARTDASGQARLRLPAAWAELREFAVQACAEGFGAATAWVRPERWIEPEDEDDEQQEPEQPERREVPADRRPAVELQLWPGLTVAGMVCDPGGHGLPARVSGSFRAQGIVGRRPAARLEATCDAEGRFTLTGVAAGAGRGRSPGPLWAEVQLTVELEGWLPAVETALLGPGVPPRRVVLAPAQPIEVLVRGADGAPLAGAHVVHAPSGFYQRPWDEEGERTLPTTDDRGGLRLDPIPAHTFLAVWGEGHAAALFEVQLPLPLLELSLERGGRVSGRVMSRSRAGEVTVSLPRRLSAARPLLERPGVRRVEPTEGLWPLDRAPCDAEGKFELRGLPVGVELELLAQEIRARARAGDSDVILDADRPTGTAGVVCVDAETRLPLPCLARVLRGDGRVSSDGWVDERGQAAALSVRGQGPIELLLQAAGHVPVRLTAVLRPPERIELGEVALASGARLALQPSWPDTPVGGLRVEWSAPALGLEMEEVLTCPTRVGQALSLEGGLPAGTPLSVRIELLPWDHDAAPREVLATELTLEAGETRTLAVELR